MARSPARRAYSPGPSYGIASKKRMTELQTFLKRPGAAPRSAASGKRSYRDSRGRIRWGKPHVVQRYHARKRK